jgi:hypothetical protein
VSNARNVALGTTRWEIPEYRDCCLHTTSNGWKHCVPTAVCIGPFSNAFLCNSGQHTHTGKVGERRTTPRHNRRSHSALMPYTAATKTQLIRAPKRCMACLCTQTARYVRLQGRNGFSTNTTTASQFEIGGASPSHTGNCSQNAQCACNYNRKCWELWLGNIVLSVAPANSATFRNNTAARLCTVCCTYYRCGARLQNCDTFILLLVYGCFRQFWRSWSGDRHTWTSSGFVGRAFIISVAG